MVTSDVCCVLAVEFSAGSLTAAGACSDCDTIKDTEVGRCCSSASHVEGCVSSSVVGEMWPTSSLVGGAGVGRRNVAPEGCE
jgi:hypothetical protein